MSNRFNEMYREAPNAKDSPIKYRNKIHSESRKDKDLPYTFSKPTKDKARRVYVQCTRCGRDFFVTEDTILAICLCGEISRLKDSRRKGDLEDV